MTNEEAIKRLKEVRGTVQPFIYVNEALDYAIKVLEQKPKYTDEKNLSLNDTKEREGKHND